VHQVALTPQEFAHDTMPLARLAKRIAANPSTHGKVILKEKIMLSSST
jgi:hypothetical protein